jgi:hypothetical protein
VTKRKTPASKLPPKLSLDQQKAAYEDVYRPEQTLAGWQSLGNGKRRRTAGKRAPQE